MEETAPHIEGLEDAFSGIFDIRCDLFVHIVIHGYAFIDHIHDRIWRNVARGKEHFSF